MVAFDGAVGGVTAAEDIAELALDDGQGGLLGADRGEEFTEGAEADLGGGGIAGEALLELDDAGDVLAGGAAAVVADTEPENAVRAAWAKFLS